MANKTQLEKLREIERQLDAELRRLRSTIRASERGENKRIKNTTKYIARQSRAMQKVVREQERAQEQELARLEKFLGESFETLAEARKSFAKDIRKATKKEIQQEVSRLRTKKNASRSDKQKQRIEREIERLQGKQSKRVPAKKKLDPSKPSYSVRQLSNLENQRVISFLTDQKSFDDAGQGYLQPGEYLSVRVPYKYHGANGEELTGYAVGLPRNIVGNWTDLRKYILSYAGMNPAEVSDSVEEWMGRIEVVKFASKFDQKLERAKFIDLKAKRRKAASKYFKERDKRERQAAIAKVKEEYQQKLNEQYRKMAPDAYNYWRSQQRKAMRDEIRHIKQS